MPTPGNDPTGTRLATHRLPANPPFGDDPDLHESVNDAKMSRLENVC